MTIIEFTSGFEETLDTLPGKLCNLIALSLTSESKEVEEYLKLGYKSTPILKDVYEFEVCGNSLIVKFNAKEDKFKVIFKSDENY